MVECRTPEREVGGSPPCCVLEQDTLLPESTGELPRKRWLRPDMTEKLLTGTLSLNTNKSFSLLIVNFLRILYGLRRYDLPLSQDIWNSN